MSDGPWGIDDSQANTTVNHYEVSSNDIAFDENEFPVERNISLNATTSTYFAAYRALTPRFMAVDLSNYNSFKLRAKGTGNLEIAFVKTSISNWEEQYKTTITLTDNLQEFEIPFSDFSSALSSDLVLDDIVTIAFTMDSENGSMVTKEMNLQNVRFSQTSTLSINEMSNENNKLRAFPNPFRLATTITLPEKAQYVEIQVMDVMGRLIDLQRIKTEANGTRAIYLNKNLKTGIYNYILKADYNQNYFGTFIID